VLEEVMLNEQKSATTVYAILNHILTQHPELMENVILRHRTALSKTIWDFHHNTVAYGPFKGLKLGQNSHWGGADRGAMTLGLYEQEVLLDLATLKRRFNTFVDLGAADGYYGIGVLVGNLFNKSYCFEISEDGQKVIRENSVLNGVHHQLVVNGKAEKDFYKQIAEDDLSNCVLFVDIEGGEFELFDAQLFAKFQDAIIYIELHDWFFQDGEEKLKKMKEDSSLTHSWVELRTTARDLSAYSELHKLNDSDRWLICSEGRGRLMTWVKLVPK
jgi:hypothetical protein